MPITGYFDTVFASSGSLATVPDTVQSDGSVSYAQGYGVNYTLAPGVTGALNIEETKLNQIFFDITSAIQQYQQNSVAPFITSTMNGGSAYSYPQGAQVLYGGHRYISLVAANTALPSVAANWLDVTAFPGVQFNGVNGYTSSHTFGPADYGALNYLTGSFSAGLPVSTTVRNGCTIPVFNASNGSVTIVANGSDTIIYNNTTASTFVLAPGQFAFLVSNNAGAWLVTNSVDVLLGRNNLSDIPNANAARASLIGAKSGANSDITSMSAITSIAGAASSLLLQNPTAINCANLSNTLNIPVFAAPATSAAHALVASQIAAQLSANGYVSINVNVSGVLRTLIIVWGTCTTTGGGTVHATFSTTFPNAIYSVALGLVSASPVNAYTGYSGLSGSGMDVFTNAAGAAAQLGTVTYFVVGY